MDVCIQKMKQFMAVGIITVGDTLNAASDPIHGPYSHTKTLRYLPMSVDFSFFPERFSIDH